MVLDGIQVKTKNEEGNTILHFCIFNRYTYFLYYTFSNILEKEISNNKKSRKRQIAKKIQKPPNTRKYFKSKKGNHILFITC